MHNVLVLASALYEGGAERVVEHLASHLDRRRYRVTIGHLHDRGGLGERLAAQGHEVVAVPRTRTGLRRFLSARALAGVIREYRIDLVHTHTTAALADAAVCRVLSHGRVKLVHTFHYGNYPHYPLRYRLLESLGARAADHLVAVGVEQMAVVRRIRGLVTGRPLTAVLNGIAAPEGEGDPGWRGRLAKAGRIVIGTTAVCSEQKGLDYLLEVARIMRDAGDPVLFLVAGEGPLRQTLERRRRDLGLSDTVLFTGWMPNAGATITPLFDVFFQPSRWEAMSVVVVEAMAAGKPVVATDAGENRHVVEEGVTGHVVACGDVPAMVERLRALVRSAADRERMGEAGRRRYQARYTAAVMARGYERIYEAVLSGVAVASASEGAQPCTT